LCVFFTTRPQRISQAGKNPLVTASISCIYDSKTPTHVPLALSGYATTESVLFGSAGFEPGPGRSF
jgi:hypothetical protein